MPTHIQLHVLADHVLKLLTLDDAAVEHLESCAHCRSDLRWLEQLGALRNVEPPKSAVNAVLKIFGERKSAA